MTTTPTVWKAEFTVNAGVTAGGQQNPVTIGLADGRILTAWVDHANNVDDDPDRDIIGRIYDAQGNAVGAPFQLNQFASMLEDHPSIAALPDGGFAIAYGDSGDGLADPWIRYERYNAAAARIVAGTIDVGIDAAVEVLAPSVAALANGDFVVSYVQLTQGDYNIVARVVSGSTVGPQLAAGRNSANRDVHPDTIVLSNGNILTVYANTTASSVESKIVSAAGAPVGYAELSARGSDPNAAALTGGGFAVVWLEAVDNGDIRAEVRDNSGGVVRPSFVVSGGGFVPEEEPDVVALKDGGFFVVWDDHSLDQLRGQRFDATGAPVGIAFMIAAGEVGHPELGLTDDGRILVTFENGAGELSQVILDPRNNVILGDNTSETITSRLDGATVIAFAGNDTLLGQGAADVLNGGLGADVMKGGLGNDVYYVDSIGDAVNEVGGGAGIDTVISSFSFSLVNSARLLGVIENLTLTNVAAARSATGNNFNNVITGNNFANTLIGGVGNDVIRGRSGNDVLTGGYGIDTLAGGANNDIFVFSAPLSVANRDVITDFFAPQDTFYLENAFFTRVGAPGLLKSTAFKLSTQVKDTDDRIIYNKAGGAVFYDPDGSGAAAPVLFATLVTKPTLTSADFVVI